MNARSKSGSANGQASKTNNRNQSSGNKNAANKNAGNKNSGRSRGGKKRSRQKNKPKKFDPVAFWGDREALPKPDHFETDSPEPLSVVHSLGRAPVPGVLAEPYFAAVYDRAAGLATVLSDAAGLDDLTPLDPPDDVNSGAVADTDPDRDSQPHDRTADEPDDEEDDEEE